MIELKCPECGHQLRIPRRYAGKRGGCKYCRKSFTVPQETPQAQHRAPPPQPPESPESFESPESLGSSESLGSPESPESPAPAGPPVVPAADVPVPAPEIPTADVSGFSAIEKPKSSGQGFDVDDSMGPSFGGGALAAASASASASSQLGCLYWGLAFFLPPVALAWAFFVPKDHEQRTMALVVSLSMSVLMGACLGLGVVLAG